MIAITLGISFLTAIIEFFTRGKAIVFIPYAAAVPALLLLPRIAFALSAKIKNAVNLEWLKTIELFSFYVVLLNVLGSLWFHELGFQYDRFLHLADGFFLALGVFLLIVPFRLALNREENAKLRIIFWIFLGSLAAIFLWEGYQYAADRVFGTDLFFDVKQEIKLDFFEDVVFSFLGLLLGALYLYYSFGKFLSKFILKKEPVR